MNQTTFATAIILCAAAPLPLHAQNLLTNGDLESNSTERTVFIDPDGTPYIGSVLPDGWSQIPHTSSFSSATEELRATTDTLNHVDLVPGQGLASKPHSGNTFVSGLHATDGWHEGIQQQVDLTGGLKYELTFFQSVIKQSYQLEDTGTWQVYLGDVLIFTPDDTFSGEAHDSLNHPWEQRSTTFTAPSDGRHTLSFIAYDSDGTPDLRMGLDSASLIPASPEQVPEPSSLSLLALGTAALLARRTR